MNTSEQSSWYRSRYRDTAILCGLTAAAVAIHGYHLGIEDQAIYLPAILKHLDPALFPRAPNFFEAQTAPMLLDDMVAWFVRFTHVPVDWALFGFHLLTIYLLLWACYRIARRSFARPEAVWASLGLITGMLTLPIAGTAQYIVDQYLHPRAVATALVLIPVADLIPAAGKPRGAKAFAWCGLYFVLAALFHLQMALFGVGLWVFLAFPWEQWIPKMGTPVALGAIPILGGLLQPGSRAWREAAQTRSQHYLTQWEWYELLGIVAPMILLLWMGTIASKKNLPVAAWLSRRIAIFGTVSLVIGSALILPPSFERLTPYQPMRVFILIYVFLLLIGGGLIGEFVLRRKLWRWLILFVPMALGMFFAQRSLFPDSPQVEFPGRTFHNDWVDAFRWIRANTPKDAYFALNPHYLSENGEDYHGFRAWAQRSQLADLDKDPGVVSLFPALAPEWKRQVDELKQWKDLAANMRFGPIHNKFGVDWVVVEKRYIWENRGYILNNFDCPYRNDSVYVCRIR